MLNVEYFRNDIIRKYVEVFGTLFNDIYIQKFDSSGARKQVMPVPIQYSGSSRNVALDEKNPITTKVQTQLPRMAYSLLSLSFAEDRTTNPLNVNFKLIAPNLAKTQFAEIPYNLEFELIIYAKTSDDAHQIVEQIIPFFRPSFFPTVTVIPEMDLKYDTKVTLNNISPNEDYEGSTDEVKIVSWTLSFTMNAYFFGPMSTQGVIKRAIVDMIPVPGSGPVTGEEVDEYGRQARITVYPGLTEDGQPTTDPDEAIPYNEVNSTDNYAIITTIEDFADDKKWDPTDGFDK